MIKLVAVFFKKKKNFSPDLQLYHSETLELMLQRWSKLERDFRMKNGRYDISKIPDIYDCIKYDLQHNASLDLEDTRELFRLSRALADIVIPQVNHISVFNCMFSKCCPALIFKFCTNLALVMSDVATLFQWRI